MENRLKADSYQSFSLPFILILSFSFGLGVVTFCSGVFSILLVATLLTPDQPFSCFIALVFSQAYKLSRPPFVNFFFHQICHKTAIKLTFLLRSEVEKL